MAMAEAYFDDSGTHPEANTAIAACYLSTVKEWKRFNSKWRKAGAKAGFRTFHMSEFAAGHGEFVGWPDPKRKRVLSKLCTIINDHITLGTVVGVLKRDYDSAIRGDFKNYCGRYHYTFVVRHCAKGPRAWLDENHSSSIRYFFDQMSKGKGEIMDVMDRALETSRLEMQQTGVLSLVDYSFGNKAIFPPLQAADILAWSYFQLIQERTAGRTLGWVPKDALDILLKADVRHKFYDAPALQKWARQETEALSRLR
jgi:hypothetical protein